MKAETFYRFLITRFEFVHAKTGKQIAHFNKNGENVPEGEEGEYFVTNEGVVYKNSEKASEVKSVYSANLGMLY